MGTPDYMAPEILQGEAHSTAVDWWSFGVLVFETLAGYLPFMGASPQEIFAHILTTSINWPKPAAAASKQSQTQEEEDDAPPELSQAAVDLIRGLLNPDPGKRLGTRGAEEVKRQRFFAGLDWRTLRTSEPPFVPRVAGAVDTKYFADGGKKKFSLKDISCDVSKDGEAKETSGSNGGDPNREELQLSGVEGTVLDTLAYLNRDAAKQALSGKPCM